MQNQGDEDNDVDALVMFGDIHYYLQEKGSQWNAGPKAKIGKDRNQGNDSEYDGTSCSFVVNKGVADKFVSLTIVASNPVINANGARVTITMIIDLGR